MADNWNGDPLYELARQGATPAQLKWAEDQMRQGKPYTDGNGMPLSGAGWSTNMPYRPTTGAPAPGKQDRYRPVRDPQTMQPITLGNAQYPPGNRLTPNAVGYTQQGTMTGANPAVAAIDNAAQPGRQVVQYTPPNTRFASLTSSTPPNYGGYTATMRMANGMPLIPGPAYVPQPVAGDPWGGMRMTGQTGAPSPEMVERVNSNIAKLIAQEQAAINRGLGIHSSAMGRMANWFTPATSLTGSGSQPPLVPGPRYVPQPVSGDPWAGMRSMGQGAAQMPGYGAAPGAPQQQPALGLLDMILGPGAGSGLAGLLSGAPRSAPSMYSPSPGTYLPTKAPSGKERRRDADSGSSSVYGSGGSLV